MLALTDQPELSLSMMKLRMILAVLSAIYATAVRSLNNSQKPHIARAMLLAIKPLALGASQ